MNIRIAFFVLLSSAVPCAAQQVADSTFRYVVARPAYVGGAGPIVCLDEAHNNFHTVGGRYRPFADILRQDGYVVQPLRVAHTAESLVACKMLVISNALAAQNVESWSLPTPSAFSTHEIAAIQDWVRRGGALLLIADHMPFPGAVAELAAGFGVEFSNAFTFDSVPLGRGGYVFRRSDNSLRTHPITRGRNLTESVDSVAAGYGSAFRAPSLQPVLVLRETVVLRFPSVAWEFDPDTRETPGGGLLQGAVGTFGLGRLAVFGKAGMFSAQITANGSPNGMNHPLARQNPQFLLNLVHWLSGLLP